MTMTGPDAGRAGATDDDVRTPAELFDLTGTVALVTGGSRGLGRAIVLAYAAAGADVIIASRKLEACEDLAREVESLGRRALPVACHVGRWDDLDALVERTYAEFPAVDILVNNAGMSPVAPSSVATSEELFDKVVAVNFKGPFRLSSVVAERMTAGSGGSVIGISSSGALRPSPNFGPYAGSKAALNAISVAFAQEFAPKVRFNIISPGGFYTDISKSWATPGVEVPTVLMKRFGYPREIVTAALYFASDASSFTTGSLLRVDGLTPV
jgi:NAD(P)-dependent dehydrogenase (short-subunit alcohol dehydrogenase family)